MTPAARAQYNRHSLRARMETTSEATLRSIHATTHLDVAINAWESLTASLRRFDRRWPARPIDLYGVDSTDFGLVGLHLHLGHAGQESGNEALHLDIGRSTLRTFPRVPPRQRKRLTTDVQAIDELLKNLQPYGESVEFHATISWRFAVDSVVPVIGLPILRLDLPGFPFEQIAGVRFAVSSSDQHAILDLDDQGRLSVSVHVATEENLDSSITSRLVQRATRLKDALVSPVNRRPES